MRSLLQDKLLGQEIPMYSFYHESPRPQYTPTDHVKPRLA